MTIELVRALLLIAKVCASAVSCDQCPLKKFCEKSPAEW